MISVARVAASVRYAVSDMQGAQFSDFDVLEALNRAASLLFGRLAARAVKAAVKKTVLPVEEDECCTTLPGDFHSVRRVSCEQLGDLIPTGTPPVREWEYRIAGGTLYGLPGVYGLEYYYLPAEVSALTDELDAPESVSPWLEQMTAAILKGDMTGAAQVAETCCTTLAGGEVSRLPDMGPVQVLGGRL